MRVLKFVDVQEWHRDLAYAKAKALEHIEEHTTSRSKQYVQLPSSGWRLA